MEFRFKKFIVKQSRSAMRVNTDGVLLGAWMSLSESGDKAMERILDIGTGTGVIALMAAQRLAEQQTPSVIIEALEIDENSYNDASENFINSPWGDDNKEITLKAIHCSLQEYPQSEYDCIFSNPPYFIDSLKSTIEARSNARHTDTLSQSEIIKYSLISLKEGGKLALILPAEEGEKFLIKINFLLKTALEKPKKYDKTLKSVLTPIRLCKVRTTAKKNPKRYLMEFELVSIENVRQCVFEELVIIENGDYTLQYRQLVGDFYLNF